MTRREPIHSLRLDTMSFAYEGSVDSQMFHQVSAQLPRARAVWLRTQDGRGKSTLLKILAGLLSPQQGRYLINEQNVTEMSFEQFLPYRLNFGYGFDMFGLLNNKTIFENLLLPMEYHKLLPAEEAHLRVEETLAQFGLLGGAGAATAGVAHLRPFAITGSQRKLTCILRAFIHWPEIVLLDDPAIGLKQDSLQALFKYIEDGFALRGLKQIFFTSENLEFTKHFAPEEVMLSLNKITVEQVN